MLTYPNLISALTGVELEATAEASGLTPEILDAVLHRGVAASLSVRARLARVLAADPVELFRLTDELEALLDGAPSRYVTDPAALRAVDGRPAA